MFAARPDGARRNEQGFTLIEMLCVVAIIAFIAAVALPLLPHGTSRARLESYAIAAATVLKADHDAALTRGTQIATEIDTTSRLIRSGASDRVVYIPNDVEFDALLAAHCSNYAAQFVIRFFSSGMSCGGAIRLTRSGFGYQVRVNWLTGGVEIVPLKAT
jgi:general secretion pathway protein H